MIRTACTLCSKKYQLRDDVGGHWVRCKECEAAFLVPRRYTERFEQFLERAPKPQTRRAPRERGLPTPFGPVAAVAAALPALDRDHWKVVAVGVGGLAVMGFTSFMTFVIAHVAMS